MYKIKVTPNYYAGTCNAPKQHFLTRRELPEEHKDWNWNSSEIVQFETEQEAQAIIDAIDPDGVYYLAHGEAGRPEYEIDTDEGNGWGDDCVDSSGAYGDDWEEVDGDDLPDGVKDTLDGLGIDYHRDGDNDTEIWTAEKEIDGVEYAIAFRAKSIAVQEYGDDLVFLNWDKQTYYRRDTARVWE